MSPTESTPSAADLDAYRETQRKVWDSGDYGDVAERFTWAEGPVAVEAAAVGAGDRVLDLACGTGNVAIRVAETGAASVALDVAPGLLAEAGRNAAEAGVEVELVEGDAAEMPFESESFDAVLSVFGVAFAPRPADCAAEIARVLRPGGRIALINWTPEGMIGQTLKTIGAAMPKPPGFVQPPPQWGAPAQVEALFEGTGVALRSEIGNATFEHESAAAYVDMMAELYGPMLGARRKLEGEGRWDQLRSQVIELSEAANTASSGFAAAGEYLLITGRKSA
jgi:ubiquinone/menaquinone biosynthesis C-methylase UbiE